MIFNPIINSLHLYMSHPTPHQRSVRSELVAIAGQPNWVQCLRPMGVRVRVFIWRLTTKGRRAGDMTRLLVLADRARDLGAEVYYLKSGTSQYWYLNGVLADQSDATAVAVWVKEE